MADLISPERIELSIRKKFHADAKTMEFSKQTETFSEEDLDTFYEMLQQTDDRQYCYRLVFCDGCMDFVSETEWKYDPATRIYWWNAIVRYDLRKEGYGHETLRLMKLEAKKYDIHAFCTKIGKENTAARGFLQHEGFILLEETDDTETYKVVI